MDGRELFNPRASVCRSRSAHTPAENFGSVRPQQHKYNYFGFLFCALATTVTAYRIHNKPLAKLIQYMEYMMNERLGRHLSLTHMLASFDMTAVHAVYRKN